MLSEKPLYPSYSRPEVLADACVHAASLLFGIAAAAALLAAAASRLSAADLAGIVVYCAALLGMFAASAAYNLVSPWGMKEVLRRLDHAAIFIMIAGTYTPLALAVRGGAGYGMLAAVWMVAAAGITIKLRFPRRYDKLLILLYLAQGWMAVFALGPIVSSLPAHALIMLLAGGVLYTLGVPFHLMEWLRFHNVIWHLFVLAGAACQFVAVRAAVMQS